MSMLHTSRSTKYVMWNLNDDGTLIVPHVLRREATEWDEFIVQKTAELKKALKEREKKAKADKTNSREEWMKICRHLMT